MNKELENTIECYAELLKKLAKSKNLSTEQVVEQLHIIGKMMANERSFYYENNLINPLHD
jgi:hypothetical protein